VLDGSINHAEARQIVKDVLEDSQGWDGLQWIDFRGYVNWSECIPMALNDVEFAGLRVFTKVTDDVTAICGQNTAGCARLHFPYPDPSSGHPEDEFLAGEIYIGTEYLQSDPAHIVNHEVGHVLGLADGGPTRPTPYPSTLNNETPGACNTGSVMHSYGCSNEDWPSDNDKEAVEALVAPQGGGSGLDKFLSW
jgi:hypothetical protein